MRDVMSPSPLALNLVHAGGNPDGSPDAPCLSALVEYGYSVLSDVMHDSPVVDPVQAILILKSTEVIPMLVSTHPL